MVKGVCLALMLGSYLGALEILCQEELKMQQDTLKIVEEKNVKNPTKELTQRKEELLRKIAQIKQGCSNDSVIAEVKENILALQSKLTAAKEALAQGSKDAAQTRDKALEYEILHQQLIAAKQELLRLNDRLKSAR